jgi:hypothetical protein
MPELPCPCPPEHPHAEKNGAPGGCLIDQCPCTGPVPLPNAYVMPGQPMAAEPGFDTPAPGAGPGQGGAPDADLSEVLVNYDEVFQAVHMRHLQDRAVLVQENAELRAAFNQAAARMKAAEAERDTLREILNGGQ